MKDILDVLLSILKEGKLPLWPVYLLLPTLFILKIVQSYFVNQFDITTPLEARRRGRIKYITGQLEIESNSGFKSLLEEERHRLLFLEITSIVASPKRRNQLHNLYMLVSGRLGWRDIRMANPYLRTDANGNLIRGVHIMNKVFMCIYFAFAVAFFVLAMYSQSIISRAVTPSNSLTSIVLDVLSLFVLVIFLLTSTGVFKLGLPVLRALQLQKWVPDKHYSQNQADVRRSEVS